MIPKDIQFRFAAGKGFLWQVELFQAQDCVFLGITDSSLSRIRSQVSLGNFLP